MKYILVREEDEDKKTKSDKTGILSWRKSRMRSTRRTMTGALRRLQIQRSVRSFKGRI